MFRPLVLASLLLPVSLALAAPPPGHPSTDQAAKILGVPEQASQPYSGRVMQTIDSNNYTYIEVAQRGGKRLWLAAPRVALAQGTDIAFGEGALMTNFYSKKLKRTFDQILFVGGVRPIGQ